MTETHEDSKNYKIGFRTAGRVLAVQGLYVLEVTNQNASTVMDNLEVMVDKQFIPHIDKNHCDYAHTNDILKGVTGHQSTIDPLIINFLPEKWTIKRLDRVLCALLRAAIFEILFKKDIAAKIIINEYMNMASAFGLQESNQMVGGILNKIAHDPSIATPNNE